MRRMLGGRARGERGWGGGMMDGLSCCARLKAFPTVDTGFEMSDAGHTPPPLPMP